MARGHKVEKVKTNCFHCGQTVYRYPSEMKATKKRNGKVFCNLKCLGAHRDKGAEHRRAYHKAYKKKWDAENRDRINAQKRKRYRESPEIRANKKRADRLRWLRNEYGGFWESALILQDIQRSSEITEYKVEKRNKKVSKTQERKRHDEKLNSGEFEREPLGNIEQCQNGRNAALSG